MRGSSRAELIAELATTARCQPLLHPGDAPGRTGVPAVEGVGRLRPPPRPDLSLPHCDVPATDCDIDHTIAHGDGGPTHASNLSCKCRFHHLLKTFWGWRDEQLRDGTLIWTSPTGQKTVTHPGSALIFPTLCAPTGPLPVGTPPGPTATATRPR